MVPRPVQLATTHRPVDRERLPAGRRHASACLPSSRSCASRSPAHAMNRLPTVSVPTATKPSARQVRHLRPTGPIVSIRRHRWARPLRPTRPRAAHRRCRRSPATDSSAASLAPRPSPTCSPSISRPECAAGRSVRTATRSRRRCTSSDGPAASPCWSSKTASEATRRSPSTTPASSCGDVRVSRSRGTSISHRS